MSFDSIVQLTQARSGFFTDQHPPVMAALWRVLDRVSPGPQGMLLFHNAIFWSGAALLCYLTISRVWLAAGAVLFVGLFAPVFGLLSTIWKDVGLGSALLLAFALLFHSDRTNSKRSLLTSVFPLLYGLSARHNAVFAVLPLTLFGGIVGSRLFGSRDSLRAGFLMGLVAFGWMFASVGLIDRLLVDGRRTFHYQVFMLHDLVALSLRRSALLIPPAFYWDREEPTLEGLRKIYDPVNVVPLYGGVPFSKPLKFSSNSHEVAVLRKAWLLGILGGMRAYLDHRWIIFKAQLGLGGQPICYPYHSGIEPNTLGVHSRSSRLNDRAMAYLSVFRETVLFRAWFYLLITFALLGVAIFTSELMRLPAIALAASSLLYEFAYLFIAPTCDFRFNWWTVVATMALGLYMLSQPTRRRS